MMWTIKQHFTNKKRKKSTKEINKRFCCNFKFDCQLNDVFLEGNNYCGSKCNLTRSKIGYGSYFGENVSLPYSLIGRYTSIASNVRVVYRTHPTDFVTLYPFPFFENSNWKDELFIDGHSVKIGNDVWIGDNVLIKGGITIGDGAVIGMGAVVTKDIPPYAIVGGVPAKIIRYRFDQETIKKLLEIRWWDWQPHFITQKKNDFSDVGAFIENHYKNK